MFLLVPDVRIAFIYFNHNENPSAVDLLGSLLQQLLQQGTEISSTIRDLYAKHQSRRTRPSLDEISALFISESRAFSNLKLYMVVDALDECSAERNTKDKVLAVLRKLPNLRLLITSRPHVDISSSFNAVQLDIRADNHDIKAFICGRLEENCYLKRYVREDFKETLIDKVIKKSDGM
jgi:hypothetical protein